MGVECNARRPTHDRLVQRDPRLPLTANGHERPLDRGATCGGRSDRVNDPARRRTRAYRVLRPRDGSAPPSPSDPWRADARMVAASQ